MYILGFDIGGTKCAVITAKVDDGNIQILKKEKCPTDRTIAPEKMIEKLISLADTIIEKTPDSIGISCGGPLDSKKGVIMSPPNLPEWDNVQIVKQLEEHYGCSAHLQNDANACAVAEWKFGAGKGCNNVVFMTFGTGLGAGLILDGKLYSGTNDNAGELGHIRLDRFGPVGYGKAGSFEGFCSGNGIAQLGYTLALEKVQRGKYPAYFKPGMTAEDITAKTVADAADAGDETAIEVPSVLRGADITAKAVFDAVKSGDAVAIEIAEQFGEYLGKGLSIVIDLLNPEVIVIGSVFARSHNLLWDATKKVIDKEALSVAAECCKVVPAELGEKIGDYASIATALL